MKKMFVFITALIAGVISTTAFANDEALIKELRAKVHIALYEKNALDVFNFYPAIDPDTGKPNEFAEVEAIGRVINDDNKSATNKLRIVKKISLKQLIKATISMNNLVTVGHAKNAAATVGDYEDAATFKAWSPAVTLGRRSDAITSGEESIATTVGDHANAVTLGPCSDAITSGEESIATTVGDYANAVTAGHWSKAVTLKEYSKAIALGKSSIAAALGEESKAKAALGGWIVLAEYDNKHSPSCVKAVQVDGMKIKPNTFYRLENGEFVED